MTKIVINTCYGGFGLSEDGMRLYAQKKGLPFYVWNPDESDLFKQYFTADPSVMATIDDDFWRKHSLDYYDIERTDLALVEVVEELGNKANGQFAQLTIVDLPKGTLYRITEYDGYERIETNDTMDWNVA